MTNAYDMAYTRAQDEPEAFWAEAAREIDWYKTWDKVLDDSNPPFYRWFLGAECNTCFNALDRHVKAGRGEQAALIYDSPVTNNTKRTYTYNQLLNEVSLFAGVLRKEGVGRGDRVIIYMPMVPEAAIAMLACARLGAIHSVVFGGFASNELAVRIDDAKPTAIISATCGVEVNKVINYMPLLNGAIDLAKHKPSVCIILARPEAEAELKEGRDIDWASAMLMAEPAKCVPVAATDPLYILYTSGTTGQPKGVVRDNGGHMVALKWSMSAIYDCNPGDVYWAASDVGWVVGHSYIVYAPLINGCTTVLYEGKPVGTPDAGAFWRMISEYDIKVLFTAPTAFRAIKREDPAGALLANYDMSSFKSLFLAGERLDPDTLQWAQEKLKVPVIDHWWQTETGWSIAANCLGLHALPIKAGSPTKAAPGWDVSVVNDEGENVPNGQIGSIVIKLPMPPAALPTLWEKDEIFIEKYMVDFPGYYNTADAGMIDDDGYLYIMARTDDIINVAGHRLSTGGIEEVLADHPDVAECAVIGVADQLKGQLPIGFLVLNAGTQTSEDAIIADTVAMVRERIGAVAAYKTAVVVERLPKTRSGKILRSTMQKIADQEDYSMPATIDDPLILGEMDEALQSIGYSKARA
ncbi:MAG: propionyl-CoA synthetase [Rhodospirillaceae bacterium TMED8]|nr:propionyl-CoA synthetase [Magnetovibrio sp.]OUT50189.1 MAG: propionyl-CoA synthetase [Rhodospirillaceae bacterium TMED8]